jgi:RHS repeat-associated protein
MPTGSLDYPHAATPTIQVTDPRGLAVRAVQYHRRQAADPVEARITHQRFDTAGRPVASRDPYLFALAQFDASVPANLIQTFSLSNIPVLTRSVDAGERMVLLGAAGQEIERWDGRGSHSLTEYDTLLRPMAVRERGRGVAEHTLERFAYASADGCAHNLCGQLIRHDDPAGTLHLIDLSLGGAVLKQTRHFLRDTDPPDWPSSVAGRDALLEAGDGATTWHAYAPLSEPVSQTDALGNIQAFAYTVAGQLKNTRLTPAGSGQVEQLLVSDIHYNVFGQVDSETAGNSVITRHHYDPANGRLTNLSAHKADGTPLQDLSYHYDPVGNVLSIEDAPQPIRYFNNQRIKPIKTYRYDTLYQLIHATGWEAKTGRGGPALPDLQPLPPDPNQIANYTQTYHYDAGGNLLDLVHLGNQAHGRTLTRARYSNRCLPERDGRPPTEDELATGFDANGNLRELQPGQPLSWDLRNQLQEVRPVVREDAKDDSERYIYDGGGQRVRKVRTSQTNARTLISEVRYLPGLEIRTHGGNGEILHVITASAGSNSVQVLHWVAKPPDDIADDQMRYSFCDHLGSSTLELDQQADLISQESYYPFGGTAWWAGRNATEAKYKTVRYSGKERDAAGLYYYGFRYYAPWLQRWINPDPAGAIDGLNFYRMVRNSPITLFDQDGLSPPGDLAREIMASKSFNKAYKYNPESALEVMKKTNLAAGYAPGVVAKALKRVQKEMNSIEESVAQHMKNLEITENKKNLPASVQPYDLSMFKAIFSTNEGAKKINHGMRTGQQIVINPRTVVNEIAERVKGEGLPDKAAKDIRLFAGLFNLADASQVGIQTYNQSRFESTTSFRGQDITDKGMQDFMSAQKEGTVLHSKSFLTVTTKENIAKKFMHGEMQLFMEIEGFSATSVQHSTYSVQSENDAVFSTYADFKVTSVGRLPKTQNQFYVMLKEIRAHNGYRTKMPY